MCMSAECNATHTCMPQQHVVFEHPSDLKGSRDSQSGGNLATGTNVLKLCLLPSLQRPESDETRLVIVAAQGDFRTDDLDIFPLLEAYSQKHNLTFRCHFPRHSQPHVQCIPPWMWNLFEGRLSASFRTQ